MFSLLLNKTFTNLHDCNTGDAQSQPANRELHSYYWLSFIIPTGPLSMQPYSYSTSTTFSLPLNFATTQSTNVYYYSTSQLSQPMILILVLKILQLLSQIPKPQTIEGVQVGFSTWQLHRIIRASGAFVLLNIFKWRSSTSKRNTQNLSRNWFHMISKD